MVAHILPKSGLVKQDYRDRLWQDPLNSGFDTWEGRIGLSGAGSPIGVVAGSFIGQTYFDTARNFFYLCNTVGDPSTASWIELPRIFDNYIELGDGRQINSTHNKLVVGNTTNVPVNWTLTGPFNIGTRIQIAGGWHLGGPVTIHADPGDIHSFIFSVNQALTALNLLATDQGDLYCVDGHIWLWTGLRHFVSPVFTPTPGFATSWAHGLGYRPQKLIFRLTCQVTEYGWAVGDVLYLAPGPQPGGNGHCGIIIKADVNNVAVKVGTGGLQVLSGGAGTLSLITPANWSCVLRAETVN